MLESGTIPRSHYDPIRDFDLMETRLYDHKETRPQNNMCAHTELLSHDLSC